MIFVTVGTTDYDDLVRKMDEIAPEVDQEVMIQIGRGNYIPVNCKHFRFAPSILEYFDQADIVVSHGGLGTLIEVIQRKKKLIGLSNPDRFDHHQEDLLKLLSDRKQIVWCKSLDMLKDCITNIDKFELVSYEADDCHIADSIKEYLNKCFPGVASKK